VTLGDRERRLRRLAEPAPFAVLATHGEGRRLDLVPCCFAVDTSTGRPELVTAVDHKPKRHRRLARLANIDRDPNVTVLVDHRDADDWSQLWWVRVQGRARVVEDGPEHEAAVAALCAKYPQYRVEPPAGAVIRVAPDRWTGWSGAFDG
jgi:PPOX class probable F420-dependent enzyme